MEKKEFVKNFKDKDQINSPFFVRYISLMEARDGRGYLNLILADKTGEVEARVFTHAKELNQIFVAGSYAHIQGKVQLYQKRMQLIVQEMHLIEESDIDRSDYIIQSNLPADQMFEELLAIVSNLEVEPIKLLLTHILRDGEIARRLKKWPAGKSIHHAYEGGLLEHILSCTKLAVTLSHHYEVNQSYLVAGTILHDIAKIYEITDSDLVSYTDEGQLLGHLVKGIELIERFASAIKDFHPKMKLHLKHLVASHHGCLEHGSPKTPATLEAILLHQIDMMDSRMGAASLALKQDHQAGAFTGFVKHLDVALYKGSLPQGFMDVEAVKKQDKSGDLKQNLGSLLKEFKTKE